MAESDRIEQLDRGLEAMFSGAAAPPLGDEATELLRIAAYVRNLPNQQFQMSLKAELMALAREERKRMTATTTNWIREGFHTLTPYLHVPSSAKLVDFLKDVFGAEEKARYLRPNGVIMHAELRIGDSVVELGEDPPAEWALGGASFRAYVEDVDAVYRRALAAGARSLYEPVDQSYGDREAAIADPAGNYWFIARSLGANYKYPGLQDVQNYFFPTGTPAFIDFLKSAFDAEVLGRHETPGGRVMHASLKIGDTTLGMGEAQGQWQPMPAGIHMYVPDVDAAYKRAIAAGATSLREPADQPYGERSGTVVDPMGNHWYLATLTGDVHM